MARKKVASGKEARPKKRKKEARRILV